MQTGGRLQQSRRHDPGLFGWDPMGVDVSKGGIGMKGILLLTCFLSPSIVFASCDSDTGPEGGEGTPVSYENIAPETIIMHVNEAGTVVYTDNASWTAMWLQECGACEIPTVDFGSYRVVAVFYGEGIYSGCGCWVDVFETITETSTKIEIRLDTSDIDDMLGACDGMVTPIQFAKIAKSSKPVVFAGDVPE
jgi:hypothetical protein